MIYYDSLDVGDIIHSIETTSHIVTLEITNKLIVGGTKRLGVRTPDLIFEINFEDICEDSYMSFEEAKAHSIKQLLIAVNNLIIELTDNKIVDYYGLEEEVLKYKEEFPELFI